MVREFRGEPSARGNVEPIPRDVPGIGATKPAMEPQRITAALDDLAAGLGLNREEILEAINQRMERLRPQGGPEESPEGRRSLSESPLGQYVTESIGQRMGER